MRVLLFSVPILLWLLVSTVKCQEEEEGNGGKSLWTRLRDVFKSMLDEMRDWWRDFKEEVRAKTKDMGNFGQEMWDTMKNKLNEWVNSQNDLDDSQKLEMKNYIERMQMPEEGKKERKK